MRMPAASRGVYATRQCRPPAVAKVMPDRLRYNIAVIRILAPIALATALLLLACSCDYPEEGFYKLTAVDASGRQLASFPFSVEELVDDTEMTTGYQVLLPRTGGPHGAQLIVVPLQNGPDLEHRTWSLALASADSKAGDLLLDILHENDILSFSGAYRSAPGEAIDLLSGRYEPAASGAADRVAFIAPPKSAPSTGTAILWEMVGITQKDFEKVLGMPYRQARRVDAQAVGQDFLDAVASARTKPVSGSAGTAETAAGAQVDRRQSPPTGKPGEKSKPPRRYGQRPR